jgi:hypothetical protein
MLGVELHKVLATNPATAHICRQLGYTQIAKYKVLDFMHEGEPYFRGIREDAEYATTFVKKLM